MKQIIQSLRRINPFYHRTRTDQKILRILDRITRAGAWRTMEIHFPDSGGQNTGAPESTPRNQNGSGREAMRPAIEACKPAPGLPVITLDLPQESLEALDRLLETARQCRVTSALIHFRSLSTPK